MWLSSKKSAQPETAGSIQDPRRFGVAAVFGVWCSRRLFVLERVTERGCRRGNMYLKVRFHVTCQGWYTFGMCVHECVCCESSVCACVSRVVKRSALRQIPFLRGTRVGLRVWSITCQTVRTGQGWASGWALTLSCGPPATLTPWKANKAPNTWSYIYEFVLQEKSDTGSEGVSSPVHPGV